MLADSLHFLQNNDSQTLLQWIRNFLLAMYPRAWEYLQFKEKKKKEWSTNKNSISFFRFPNVFIILWEQFEVAWVGQEVHGELCGPGIKHKGDKTDTLGLPLSPGAIGLILKAKLIQVYRVTPFFKRQVEDEGWLV